MTKRLILTYIVVIAWIGISVSAQDDVIFTQPVAEKILVSQTDDDHIVSVVGEPGAVAPFSRVAVRNLYTNQTAVADASADGSFSTTLYGYENMLYKIADGTDIWDEMGMLYPLDSMSIIVYPAYDDTDLNDEFSSGLGGWVSYGWVIWLSENTINARHFEPGDNLSLTMQTTFQLHPILIREPFPEFTMRGNFGLHQIADGTGNLVSTDIGLSETGTLELNSIDLPEIGGEQIHIATVETNDVNLDMQTNELSFTFEFDTVLTSNVSSGIYVPVFSGMMQVDDRDIDYWYVNRYFAIDGTNGITTQATMRPIVKIMPFAITVGDVDLASNQ